MPRRTPEQQNKIIDMMTSQWVEVHFYPPPSGKLKPYACEHCDCLMTITGNLPDVKDIKSWYHWKGCSVDGDHGVRKVHSMNSARFGDCCVSCKDFYQNSRENNTDTGE